MKVGTVGGGIEYPLPNNAPTTHACTRTVEGVLIACRMGVDMRRDTGLTLETFATVSLLSFRLGMWFYNHAAHA